MKIAVNCPVKRGDQSVLSWKVLCAFSKFLSDKVNDEMIYEMDHT